MILGAIILLLLMYLVWFSLYSNVKSKFTTLQLNTAKDIFTKNPDTKFTDFKEKMNVDIVDYNLLKSYVL
jgi:hypothetical protein